MPETARGYTYPASTGATRLWEHFEELATDIDADVATIATALEDKVTVVYKAAQESLASSTTLQDDDDLLVTLPVGLWRVEVYLSTSGSSGSPWDIKTAWSFSGTSINEVGRMCVGVAPGTANNNLDTNMRAASHATTTSVGYGTDGATGGVVHEDMLWNVTVEGVLQLRWAQDGTSVLPVTVNAGSRMYVTKLG